MRLKNPKNYESHKTSIHENKREIFCMICTKAFNLEKDLHRHIKMFHNEVNKHTCEVCDMGFSSKSGLGYHKTVAHWLSNGLMNK